jgi:hypothetical protein
MSLRFQAKKKQKLSGVGENETGTANTAVGAQPVDVLDVPGLVTKSGQITDQKKAVR